MSRALRFYWVVFAAGGILMALEILSSRILAPYFGNSVYVWGSIISVFLAALSVGYWWGGRLADRDPTMGGLGTMMALAGVTQGVLLLAGPRMAEALGDWTGGSPAGTLLAAAVLFVPPSVLLATVSPYAVRLAGDDLAHLGRTAGRLYALSTAGSLVGTLGATFAIIPFLQLGPGLALLVALTATTALVALGMPPARRRLPAAAVALLLLVLALFARPLAPAATGLVYERVTPYQTLRVRDVDGVRRLESDRVLHGAIDLETGETAYSYHRVVPAALLVQPEIERVLVLGMGAGNLGGYLGGELAEARFDYVDIDPAVPATARRFLGFEPGPEAVVHVTDARRFLQAAEGETWDLVFTDTYIGLSVPFHLTTREFLAEARARLAPGGVFGLNLASGLTHPFPQAMVRTVLAEFPTVYVFDVPRSGNVLVFATDDPRRLSPEELAARARALDERHQFDPTFGELAGLLLRPDLDLTNVPILSDRFAPVDRLVHMREGLE